MIQFLNAVALGVALGAALAYAAITYFTPEIPLRAAPPNRPAYNAPSNRPNHTDQPIRRRKNPPVERKRCIICSENLLTSYVRLSCGHTLDKGCYRTMTAARLSECPECERTIEGSEVVNIVDVCPICLEPFIGDYGIFNCGHSMHSQCYCRMSDNGHRKCPQCRETIHSFTSV